MKKVILFLLSISLLSGCATIDVYNHIAGSTPLKNHTIAVINFIPAEGSPSSGKDIADLFSFELLKKGFSVIQRDASESYLKKNNIDIANISIDQYANIGNMLGATKLLTGEVKEFNDRVEELNIFFIIKINIHTYTVTFNSKLIDVPTGATIWSSYTSKRYEEQEYSLLTLAKKLVKKTARRLPLVR